VPGIRRPGGVTPDCDSSRFPYAPHGGWHSLRQHNPVSLPTMHAEPGPVSEIQSASLAQLAHVPKPPQKVFPVVVVMQKQVLPPVLQRADAPLSQ